MPTPKAGYFLQDGTKVPSVTTIIGRFKECGGLINWAYNEGREGRTLYEKKDAAADVGTYTHALVEASLLGRDQPDPPHGMPDELAKQARDAFQAFRSWQDSSRLRVRPLEVPLVSERHRFGGTPDAIAQEPGEDECFSLVDWKTSRSFYPDQLLQLAAYTHLWNETHPQRQITRAIHVVRFGKNGGDFEHRFFPLDHPKLAAAWEMFVLLRRAYDLDKIVSGKS